MVGYTVQLWQLPIVGAEQNHSAKEAERHSKNRAHCLFADYVAPDALSESNAGLTLALVLQIHCVPHSD